MTYGGQMTGVMTIEYFDEHGTFQSDDFEVNFGRLPIMLMSDKCNLRSLSEAELIKLGEDGNELGGYFISNGNERVIRVLIAERRNRWLNIKRATFAKRRAGYSELGLLMRCVNSQTHHWTQNILHYVESNGTVSMEVNINGGVYIFGRL